MKMLTFPKSLKYHKTWQWQICAPHPSVFIAKRKEQYFHTCYTGQMINKQTELRRFLSADDFIAINPAVIRVSKPQSLSALTLIAA